jgi:hypothetical protein
MSPADSVVGRVGKHRALRVGGELSFLHLADAIMNGHSGQSLSRGYFHGSCGRQRCVIVHDGGRAAIGAGRQRGPCERIVVNVGGAQSVLVFQDC